MSGLAAGDLNRRVTFQRLTRPAGRGKAGQETWADIDNGPVAAQVREVLPSRAEKQDDGLPTATRRFRIRIRPRPDITGDMRILYKGLALRIISGPADVEEPRALEMMAEAYSTAGSGA